MDSNIYKCLQPGLTINIERSNGSVHGAIIKTVSLETMSVSVEWTENNMTKGKEIEFDDVIAINPELSTAAVVADVKENILGRNNVTIQRQNRRTVSKIPGPREAPRFQSSKMSIIAELPNSPLENDMEVETSASVPARSQSALPVVRPRTRNYSSDRFSIQPNGHEVTEETPQSLRIVSAAIQARRKSNIVKEMEKMKNKREEKRAQFSEIRNRRAQEFDSNCPNWDFARMVKEYRNTINCQSLSMNDPIEEHRICVCVRKRPLNKQELGKKECDIITVVSKNNILVHEPKMKVDLTKYLENQPFRFDFSFDEKATNEMVYWFTARPLVQTVFEGGKATCFAYGQTGSGKTHTMGGNFSGKLQKSSKGIYAFASQDVFLLQNQPRYRSQGLDIYVTFFEIYNGKLFDLLNKKAKLRVLEDGKQQVQVVGLQEMRVNCAEDVIRMIEIGSTCRTSGHTFANSSSSRSHACFQIILRRKGKLHGKFSLVDLAGNERGADTSSADRQTRMEAAEINKSLLALKECIRALGQNKQHTPFRESKLTQVLRDSFIGTNSRTCMIAMISPGMSSCEYTLNTLRYADRVKELPRNGTAGEAQNCMETENEEFEISREESDHILELSEDELSPHLSSFRDAVTRISELEEKATEELKEVREFCIQKVNDCNYLLDIAEQPEYDLEAFVYQTQCFLNEGSKRFLSLKETLDELTLAMQMEEQASKHMNQSHLQ
ncbi:kinesin-like protein KIF2C [Pseudonaja textilis]|uniref:kinesin-like protein KIF2C n=1 Tax=Pseudonaja textilis TaxID=8673 RepID=UPI000EA93D5E|nr:kinesin-like protein KIF2C [Pseudonaja textilis]